VEVPVPEFTCVDGDSVVDTVDVVTLAVGDELVSCEEVLVVEEG
jgi:hypothetical protein